jgi:hypothetical protein
VVKTKESGLIHKARMQPDVFSTWPEASVKNRVSTHTRTHARTRTRTPTTYPKPAHSPLERRIGAHTGGS